MHISRKATKILCTFTISIRSIETTFYLKILCHNFKCRSTWKWTCTFCLKMQEKIGRVTNAGLIGLKFFLKMKYFLLKNLYSNKIITDYKTYYITIYTNIYKHMFLNQESTTYQSEDRYWYWWQVVSSVGNKNVSHARGTLAERLT